MNVTLKSDIKKYLVSPVLLVIIGIGFVTIFPRLPPMLAGIIPLVTIIMAIALALRGVARFFGAARIASIILLILLFAAALFEGYILFVISLFNF